jgi:hypothetical protein
MALAQGIGNTIKGWMAGIGEDGNTDARDKAALRDDSKTTADLDIKYKKARDDRRQYESEWQTNLAFLKGYQWVKWSEQRQALFLPPSPPWRVRLTTNLIQPIYRTILGKITKEVSQNKVQPANETTEAEEDARAQDELLDYLRDKNNSINRSEEALKWAIITGTGLQYVCWDKSLGDELTNPDTQQVDDGQGGQIEQPHPQAGQPVHEPNADGEDDGTGNVVHMGEIDHITVSPFEFFPEPLAETTEDMEWCFYVKVRPSSYIKRKFGVDIEDETIAADDFLQFTSTGDQARSSSQTKGVLVKAYTERPNTENPEGRYVVYSKSQVFYNGPNPYPKVPIPFFECKEGIVPGRFWGRSVVSDLVPVQQAFNKTRSQMMEIQNSTARPKWAVVKNALDVGKTITTAPAEVIVYNPVPGAFELGRPSKIAGGDIPVGMFQQLERFQAEFYEIAGIHDFSHGLSGLGGVRAGFALQMLLEEDATRTGILKRAFDESCIKTDRAKLRLAKQFYIEPRTVTIVGADSSAEVKQFYGDKIPDDVQVRIVAAGALPNSMAAKQQLIMELFSEKLIPDPHLALKLMGMGNVEGVYDDVNRDTRQAQRENELLRTGVQVQAHDYDNHLVHGQEHDNDRKGEQYEQLAAQNPAIAAVYDQHMAEHRALIQAAMGQPQAPAPVSPIKDRNITQPASVEPISLPVKTDLQTPTTVPAATTQQGNQQAGADALLSLR